MKTMSIISISKQLNDIIKFLGMYFVLSFQACIQILLTNRRKQAVDLRILLGETNLVFTM